MMLKISLVATILLMIVNDAAMAAEKPWPSSKWTTKAVQTSDGHQRTTLMKGVDTKGVAGSRVAVTCTDKDLSTSMVKRITGNGAALSRQGYFTGDVAGVGTFSIDDEGKSLRWLENPSKACAEGPVTWGRQ